MNKALVADSSGIVSLTNEIDRNHTRALAFAQRFIQSKGTILVPSDVLSETLNILGKKTGHKTAITTGEMILKSDTFVVVFPNEQVVDDAFELFQSCRESVSFTDCMVMAIANYYGTKDIFGFDEIFSQEGYETPKAA